MSGAEKKTKRRRWLWVGAFALVLGAGGTLYAKSNTKPPPLDPALLVTVTKKPLEVEIIETGRVTPHERVEIKSKVPGQVARVLVREGAQVKAGDVLVELDPTDIQRELAKAEADLARAVAQRDFAKVALDRAERGVNQGVAPAFELAQTRHDQRTSLAALRGAEVARAVAQDRLRYTKIVAPIDGTVIARTIEPGETVVPGVQSTFDGKSLLTVADLSSLLVVVNLNQIDIAKVEVGRKATLTLDALPGRTYRATITKVAPASVKMTGKDQEVFPIEATLEAPDGAVKPGMTADVRVHLDAKPNVLVLPLEAVRKDAGKSVVMRVVAGRPQKTEVQVGLRNDREIEVAGLDEGERVLLRPDSAAENETKL